MKKEEKEEKEEKEREVGITQGERQRWEGNRGKEGRKITPRDRREGCSDP